MRPTRPMRLVPLAVAIVLAVSACSASSPSSDVGTAALPTAPASQAPSLSAAPSSAPSSAPSAVDSVAPSAEPSATAAATPTPTPKPTATAKPKPTPTGAPTAYQCTRLLTDAEMRKATGLKDAGLEGHRNGRPRVTGETYCGFSSSGGTIRVVVAVWTGPAMPSFEEFWGVILPRSSPVSGIGSAAIIDAGDGDGGARVGKLGLSVQIFGPNGVPAGLNAESAITQILKIVARRV
jgi:hypothetical protein